MTTYSCGLEAYSICNLIVISGQTIFTDRVEAKQMNFIVSFRALSKQRDCRQ